MLPDTYINYLVLKIVITFHIFKALLIEWWSSFGLLYRVVFRNDRPAVSFLRVTEFIHMDTDMTLGEKYVRYIWRFEGVWYEEVIGFSTASKG
jgi:hypothetical protein